MVIEQKVKQNKTLCGFFLKPRVKNGTKTYIPNTNIELSFKEMKWCARTYTRPRTSVCNFIKSQRLKSVTFSYEIDISFCECRLSRFGLQLIKFFLHDFRHAKCAVKFRRAFVLL